MPEFQPNLWAPWRMEYIRSLKEAGGDSGCFICHAREHPADDAENHVLGRAGRTLVILNRFPYSTGHTLIAPQQHVGQIEELTDDILLELMQRTRDVKRVLESAVSAQGFNIGINVGHCAGAGLPGHLHIHVVPRWSGDVNFMAVTGDVKVIPDSLRAVREQFLSRAVALGLSGYENSASQS